MRIRKIKGGTFWMWSLVFERWQITIGRNRSAMNGDVGRIFKIERRPPRAVRMLYGPG
jgi:hypothetical protein